MPSYYDDWQSAQFECKACGWKGSGTELIEGEPFSDLYEANCPKCRECVTTVMFPTIEEARSNWDKVPPLDRMMVEYMEAHQASFEARKLFAPEQLPDVEGDDLVIVWDIDQFNGGDTIIRYGNLELWREPAFYEGYWRFSEVVDLLMQKYGERVQDLVPTRKSGNFLYGDSGSASRYVEEYRRKMRQLRRRATVTTIHPK